MPKVGIGNIGRYYWAVGNLHLSFQCWEATPEKVSIMTTGEKIKLKRKEKGLTQERLASMSDLACITIQQYEGGRRQPQVAQLQKIATALDTDVLYFIDLKISE